MQPSDIRKTWLKSSEESLDIPKEEWEILNGIVKDKFMPHELPFRIKKEQIREALTSDDFKKFINHNILVLPDDLKDGGYKIGVLARAKAYSNHLDKEIEEGVLGYGKMGMVKVVQYEDGSADAVKIEPAKEESEDSLELEIMSQLGILKEAFIEFREKTKTWIGGKEAEEFSYTVQTLHRGVELEDYVRQRLGQDVKKRLDSYYTRTNPDKIQPEEVLRIALKSAQAIAGLHNQGILHFDIKPGNFMINWQDEVLTIAPIDFGFSLKLLDGQDTIQSRPRGTPLYLAPEIAVLDFPAEGGVTVKSHEDTYSKESDVYALGIMFWQLQLDIHYESLLQLVNKMKAPDRESRPKIEEVIETLREALIREKIAECSVKKKSVWFESRRVKKTEQKKEVSERVSDIVSEYEAKKETADDPEKLTESTANLILYELKESQTQTKDTQPISTIDVLQGLPKKLQEKIGKKLLIEEDDPIFSRSKELTERDSAQLKV